MRSLLIILAAALLASGCDDLKKRSEPATASKGGKPQIMIVGGDSLSWGDAAPGILKDTVHITNVGGDTLKIVEVRPSCGCTTAGIDKTMLGPGDTASVPVTLDVSHNSGYIHKTLTVMSNDSARPSVAVALVANLIRDLTAKPEFFPVASEAKSGAESTTSVALVNTSSQQITVGPPRIDDAADMLVRFDMTSPVVLEPGDSTTVVARVKPLKPGVAGADVVIPTNSQRQPTVKIRLTVSAQ